jgi:transposase-like protein
MRVNSKTGNSDLGRFACPNKRCKDYGARGRENIGVNGWSGTRRRFRQLICHHCGKTFSENYGTPFYGIHTDREKIVQALKMVVERGSMRGAAKAMDVDKDTICDWVRKASEHADTFSEYMLRDLQMTAVELDELWTTVKKNRSTSRTKIGTRRAR